MIGKTITHYKVLEKLGAGGMGVVYKAEDTRLRRIVALKFLPPELTRDQEAKDRFIHEAQSASSLDHPNICDIHDVGETDDGQLFIVMTCYEGETVKSWISKGQLRIEEAVDLAIQIAQGLQKAHDHGIVHRDIKSANVIITSDGIAKIVDFGLAKLSGRTVMTKVGTTVGTAAYMSPEQARGEPVDHRTDIWSLGVVMYEMITGQLPVKSDYQEAIVYSILNQSPTPLTAVRSGVPMELERIVNKCLEKSPAGRYQHMDELLVDLKALKKNLVTGQTSQVVGSRARMTKQRRILYGTAAIIVLAIVLGAVYFLLPSREVLDSVAVLPLENRSGDPNQEYFCDGMTDAVITELQKIKSLRIISWTSVRKYKKSDKSLPEIAKELGVKGVVEGAVSRQVDTVRITVQLIQASPEKHLWANMFDRHMRNILALQSDVARAISREIRAVITPEEQARLAVTNLVSPEAHELYLKGKFFAEKLGENDVAKAIEYFNLAIEKDSNYALAYSGLGLAYQYLCGWGYISSQEAYTKMESAATMALRKDSILAEAHLLLALKKFAYDWDFHSAEKEFRIAIELNPGSSKAHDEYSNFLADTRDIDAGIAENKRAQELDPLSVQIKLNLCMIYWNNLRQYDKAISLCREILEMDPQYLMAHYVLGATYSLQDRYSEALSEFQTYERLAPEDIYVQWNYAVLYARMGDRKRAEEYLGKIVSYAKQRYFSRTALAEVFAQLGYTDRAMECLEKAYSERQPTIRDARTKPFLDPLRSDPRFIALLKKIGPEK
jgi:serine/threonine protein kinase/tetratricopeptide (TPR) repeat protein